MASRVLLLYVLVELAVVVALAATIGVGWTVLAVLATFAVGLMVAGVQVRRHVVGLLAGFRDPSRALTDSALVGLGTVLVAVPGLASSVAGMALLIPATRAGARPVLTAVALGRIGRSAARTAPVDYIDGEVVDITDVTEFEPAALPAPRTP